MLPAFMVDTLKLASRIQIVIGVKTPLIMQLTCDLPINKFAIANHSHIHVLIVYVVEFRTLELGQILTD
jgi:hypothetical protein